MKKLLLALGLAAAAYAQTTINGSRTITGNWNASGAATTKPMKVATSDPGTCGVGEFLFRSDLTAGLNLKGCTSANVWTLFAPVTDTSTNTLTNKTLTTPTIGSFTNATHDHSNAAGGGNIGTSGLSANAVTVAKAAAILSTRQAGLIIGADTGTSALADTDDQAGFWANRLGQGVHVTEVWCQSDAGSPTIQIQKDDGSATNMLSSNLTCSTSGAATTTFVSGEDAVASGDKLNFLIVSAGGTAKRATVLVKYTLD